MHLPNLQSDSQANTVAICGRNRDRAEEMARKYDIPQVYTDYRTMLEDGELQAVIVATPDDQHYPVTMAALDAGLHVLCENPIALQVTQVRKMLDKAEAIGIKHMITLPIDGCPTSGTCIRKVMVASSLDILPLFNREYLWLIAVANVIAWPVVYYVMQEWLQRLYIQGWLRPRGLPHYRWCCGACHRNHQCPGPPGGQI